MDDDEALRLNTLHRFRKHSPRLLLEEYSHCEVPAGCGGAVLRWVDPQAGTPVIVRVFAEAKISSWIDGAPLDSSRFDLRAGSHTLALELDEIARPQRAILLLSIVRALGRDHLARGDSLVLLSSRPTSSWRLTGERPSGSWTAPEFDDRSWAVPVAIELDAEQRDDYRLRQLQEHGAVPLALPPSHAWIRVRFEIPALQVEELR